MRRLLNQGHCCGRWINCVLLVVPTSASDLNPWRVSGKLKEKLVDKVLKLANKFQRLVDEILSLTLAILILVDETFILTDELSRFINETFILTYEL